MFSLLKIMNVTVTFLMFAGIWTLKHWCQMEAPDEKGGEAF